METREARPIGGYVGEEIRRGVRNQVRFLLILVLLILMVPVCTAPYVLECVRGPFPATLEQIAALPTSGAAPHRFVRFTVDPSRLDQKAVQVRGGSDNKNDWYFFVHVNDQQFLIVHSDSDTPPLEFEGGLSDWNAFFNSNLDVASDVVPTARGVIKGKPLPVMVSGSYRMPFWIGSPICTILILACAWQVVRDRRGMWNPAKNRALRQLAKVGPVDEIALAVDAEHQAGAAKIGKMLVTRSWIIRPTRFGTDFLYMGDIAWAYRHDAKTLDDGIKVAQGEGTAAVIVDLEGSRTILALPRALADELVEDIARRIPWAVIGFDLELMRRWQVAGREAVEFVGERRKRVELGLPMDAGATWGAQG